MQLYEALGRVRTELIDKREQVASAIVKGVDVDVYHRLVGECAGFDYAVREIDRVALQLHGGDR